MRPGGRMSFYCCFKKLLLLNHLLGFTIGILYDVNLATLHVCNLLTSHVVDSLHAVWQGEGLNVLDASGIVFQGDGAGYAVLQVVGCNSKAYVGIKP